MKNKILKSSKKKLLFTICFLFLSTSIGLICTLNAITDIPKSKEQGKCEDVYNDADMRILSCKISGKDFIIARKNDSSAGITITQVK